MAFAIKLRKIDRDGDQHPQTLAIDIETREQAGGLVERLAGSYPENGRELPPLTRWFRSAAGLHVIWVQPQ